MIQDLATDLDLLIEKGDLDVFERLTTTQSCINHIKGSLQRSASELRRELERLIELSSPDEPNSRLHQRLYTVRAIAANRGLSKRLVSRLHALLLSARVALLVKQNSSATEFESAVDELIGALRPCAASGAMSLGRLPSKFPLAASRPALQILQHFGSREQRGEHALTALAWSLYWIEHANPLIENELRIPIIEVSLDDEPELAWLVFQSTLRSRQLQFGPSPEGALGLVSDEINHTVAEIWQALTGPSLLWHLERRKPFPCKGNSLGLAAAVGIVRLNAPIPTFPDRCVILGVFDSTTRKVRRVEELWRKLECASQNGMRE